MNIKELQISNILSFKYFENIAESPKIVFGPDLNIFIGENGARKSTALEVINFAFKRVLFTQFNFNQDSYQKKDTLTGPQKKEIVANPNRNNLNGLRLDPTWGTEDKPQSVRIIIELDEIDKKNILNLGNNAGKIGNAASTYSKSNIPAISHSEETFTIDIKLNRVANSFTHTITPSNSTGAFNYLANYNFYKELIRIHNFENPNDLIEPLFESFALISSFRNYNAFKSSVSLNEKTGAQQIQEIYDHDFSMSLNSNEKAEPNIFSLVRLRVADNHFALFGSKRDRSECEIEVNKIPFLTSINKKLMLVNLECKIRLTDQRTWQYSFEFIDLRRNMILTDINSLSAGQKAIVHLVFESYGRGDLKGGVIIVDEPEIHLHYQFQNEYLRVIEELNREQKCQYVLVTHSESLINSRTIHNVKRFTLNKENNTIIMSPNLTVEQKVLIKILDNTRATYAFFGKKVLLVEGDSDRYFFRAALNELNSSASQEISVLDVGGKGSFESWRNFFESFGLIVYYIGDFDNVYSLKFNGTTIIEVGDKNKIEDSLKQNKLDKLSQSQQSSLKNAFDNLINTPNYLTKPTRSIWKPLLDMFISFVKIDGNDIAQEVKQKSPTIENTIESKYSERIFILKNGDLEKYLNLKNKGLSEVIPFCNDTLKSFLANGQSDDAIEIRTILSNIVNDIEKASSI